MIGYLKGKIMQKTATDVLLENNGVGYEITCSNQALQGLKQGEVGEVYTYMAVREDGVSLYGFDSLQEKNMFLKLITVSGVGPKMGITVLSGLSLTELITKIATSDVKGLSKVKGLGKKTAERIILELREKVGAVDVETGDEQTSAVEQDFAINNDALLALMSLGFTKAECVEAIKKAVEQGASSIEQLIQYSLKNIR